MSVAVGPILIANAAGRAVLAAIAAAHADVSVQDRGAYLRVTVPGGCRVTRAAIERALGGPFTLPGDLEMVMPSFQGALAISEDEVAWCVPPGGGRAP